VIDHRKIIAKMQETAPEGMVLKGVYKDPHGMSVMGYLADGYDFYTLSPQDKADANKRRSKIGSMYLDVEGHIRVGDLVVMMTTKERIKEEKLNRHNTALARLRGFSSGAATIPEHLRLQSVFTHMQGEEPDDRRPADFGKS